MTTNIYFKDALSNKYELLDKIYYKDELTSKYKIVKTNILTDKNELSCSKIYYKDVLSDKYELLTDKIYYKDNLTNKYEIIKYKNIKKNKESKLPSEKLDSINNENEIYTKTKYKKEKIPICVKNTLWSLYFENNLQGNCQCCKTEIITKNNFDCGHIISEKQGGKIELENLKPICRSCNSSMGTTNMNNFIIKYGFDKIQNK